MHPVARRRTGWFDAGFHAAFRKRLVHALRTAPFVAADVRRVMG